MTTENKTNAKKHDWGYELIYANTKTHGGKLLVFEKSAKTDFVFSDTIERTWFVNNGKFIFRWIDTNHGDVYQQEATDGSVFSVGTLTPYNIECISSNGSLSESNSGELDRKQYVVLKQEVLQ